MYLNILMWVLTLNRHPHEWIHS